MTRWLDEQQQSAWRAWLEASLLLHDQLSRDLNADQGLSMADYEILVRLSETPGRSMRMSELAAVTLSSRSRLSHQVDRLEKEGLLVREACPTDKRGANAVMTQQGWNRLVAAAPSHVSSVRRHFVDVLSPDEFAALGRACTKVVEHLQRADDHVETRAG
jgi:DNA-binding MarR family transcriptional regulator